VSNLETAPTEVDCEGAPEGPVTELVAGREVALGRYTVVRRLLPDRVRRMVGAWCFLDHFGPDSVVNLPGMRVPPHPHIGLQTVTWLLAGEVLHRDSLGNTQTIRPGQLNLMTSGHGIAHSEESPGERPPLLHGLQLWIALPDDARHGPAAFAHHADLPAYTAAGVTGAVVIGELAGVRSPALVHTPLVGADLVVDADAEISLRPDFEYAVLVTEGSATVAGTPLVPGALLYLGSGRTSLPVTAAGPGRLFLLGGEPFTEELVMWWNFVGRSHTEIVAARGDWAAASERFGVVHGYAGDPLPAPPLPATPLKPRPRHSNPS
jgi:redox-sensitive bicupin YhaK (pirin superfamily)